MQITNHKWNKGIYLRKKWKDTYWNPNFSVQDPTIHYLHTDNGQTAHFHTHTHTTTVIMWFSLVHNLSLTLPNAHTVTYKITHNLPFNDTYLGQLVFTKRSSKISEYSRSGCWESNALLMTVTWKLIHFGSHIRPSLCSLFVVVLATVVLSVIYLDHLKNCNVIS